MRYAVDLLRDVYYGFHPERTEVALAGLGTNLLVIGAMFLAFVAMGTALFVRAEQNR
jgi:hypothetical protein